jgi:hypothetical protein
MKKLILILFILSLTTCVEAQSKRAQYDDVYASKNISKDTEAPAKKRKKLDAETRKQNRREYCKRKVNDKCKRVGQTAATIVVYRVVAFLTLITLTAAIEEWK